MLEDQKWLAWDGSDMNELLNMECIKQKNDKIVINAVYPMLEAAQSKRAGPDPDFAVGFHCSRSNHILSGVAISSQDDL